MLCKTEVLDSYYMGITTLVTIAQQLFFFVIAAYFQFDKASAGSSEDFSPPMNGGDCQRSLGWARRSTGWMMQWAYLYDM